MKRHANLLNPVGLALLIGLGAVLTSAGSFASSFGEDRPSARPAKVFFEQAPKGPNGPYLKVSEFSAVYEVVQALAPEARRPKRSQPHFIYEVEPVVSAQHETWRESPQFIYEIARREQYFQSALADNETTEVTILLERKMTPGATGGEPPTDALPADSLPTDGLEEEVKSADAPDETRFSETASSKDGYEELEDPFAEEGDEVPVVDDPFESYNRFMFDVNEGLYDYFIEPVARGYRFVLPEDVRIIIGNLFDNVAAPVKLVSSLIQGDMDKSGRVLGRFLINSTVGLGGMFDVAGQEYDIANVNEDMDQALGKRGVPTGPYIVWPFFGPSTARGTVGLGVDSLLSPTFLLGAPFTVGAGVTAGETVNNVSFIIEDKESLEESAIDEYESVRDFYLQYRENLLRD